MNELDLTLAMAYYEHVADLTSGRVPVSGVSLRWLELPVEEIFHRFVRFREWQVSEMSMGKYVSLVSQGDDSMVGLPVFPSRVFRHSAIYVRAGEFSEPGQLRGRRIGVPEWAQTAAVYSRALLQHEWGVRLAESDWYQAGVNQAGREEHVALDLPPGIRLTVAVGRSPEPTQWRHRAGPGLLNGAIEHAGSRVRGPAPHLPMPTEGPLWLLGQLRRCRRSHAGAAGRRGAATGPAGVSRWRGGGGRRGSRASGTGRGGASGRRSPGRRWR